MPLSRLQNFLRNPQGRILYVDSNNFDATDDFTNRGDSLTRPFFSLQRALIESAAFSYQAGVSNDRNDKTTIIVYPGDLYIDNRPGMSVTNNGGAAQYKKRIGLNAWIEDVNGIQEFNENSNFDIFDINNVLYQFNSIDGGVILPRGTSIVALDLRKTKIRPLYVPDPEDDSVDRSSIFKLTGNCYLTSFSFFDADLSTPVFKNYTTDRYIPTFSHHKLTTLVYADGVNKVRLGNEQTNLTDLQMYYYKVAKAYGSSSGVNIPDYPQQNQISPVIDEYRIVGPLEDNLLGITSIRSGDGLGGGNKSEITVETAHPITKLPKPHNLTQYTPFSISGVEDSPLSYNGTFIVKNIVNETTFTYTTTNVPTNIVTLPSASSFENVIIKIENDIVSSSSPYIYNCSSRTTKGMCGLWADGSKADGFKSVVIAQFTGISLQTDDNAFLLYNGDGGYLDNSTLDIDSPERPLHSNSKVIYKPSYENFHIRVSNNGFIQCVSTFAIGYSDQFVSESGGDMSVTNSNSNFGAHSLNSTGFRSTAFDRDDVGYITHIIPPKENISIENEINWLQINVPLTISAGISSHLYIQGYDNKNIPPLHKIDGYRIGAKKNDELHLISKVNGSVLTSPILMSVNSGSGISHKKEYQVGRVGTANSITSGNTIVFKTTHQILTGEKIRILSDTGELPDKINSDEIYYAVRVSNNSIKLSYNYNDAVETTPITISGIGQNGGRLTVVSSVSDKLPGDIGHPIQYSSIHKNWYLQSSSDSSNQIYNEIITQGEAELGQVTSYSYITRTSDTRQLKDKIYKLRYVIPKEYLNAREPEIGYVIQESNSVGLTTIGNNLSENLSIIDSRNEKIITAISAGSITNNSQLVNATTEKDHNLIPGDIVKVNNVKSSYNPNSTGITSTFNGSYEVLTTPSFNTFTYRISGVSTNPGTFTNTVNIRNSSTDIASLPTVSREQFKNTFFIYRVETVKKHIPGVAGQDGVYHLTILSSNVGISENVGYGLSYKKFNQDERNLYPQHDRDNLNFDPEPSVSFADYKIIGKVNTNDKKNSLTKEALNYFIQNTKVGLGITGISISGIGSTTVTIFTQTEHKLNSIKRLSPTSSGTGYTTSYNSQLLIGANPTDATCGFSTSSGGTVDSTTFRVTNGGSAFGIGQTVTVQGGNNNATFTVSEINNHIGSGLELTGFFQSDLNGVFEILEIPNSKQVKIHIPDGVEEYTPNTNNTNGLILLSSNGVGITSFKFTDIRTGIVTVTTLEPHGLIEGNKFTIVGSGHTIFNKSFLVNEVVGLTTFTFNVGIVTETKSSTKGRIFKQTISTNGNSTGKTGENLASRLNYIYAGITTTLVSLSDTQITLTTSNGIYRGDYLQIGNEVIRISSLPTGNTFNVLRGVFGTPKTSPVLGEVVRKIKVLPVELRRFSLLKATGHTFEYVGYGPGNYSTAVPQKQDRKLTDEEVLTSQSRELNGGSIVYDGTNDLGDFYRKSKKENSPISSFTGDDADGTTSEAENNGLFDSLSIENQFTSNGSSIFNGKVIFNNDIKLQRLSLKNKLFTVDDVSSIADGNISYVGVGSTYIGKIYTNGSWKPWGLISDEENIISIRPDKIVVTDLTVTGQTNLGQGVSFNSTNLVNLLVTGIGTFNGTIKGNSGTLSVQDSVNISNNLTVNGRVSTGSSFVGIVSTSDIIYSGTASLNIRTSTTSGSILIKTLNNKTSIFNLESSGDIVVGANTTGTGANGSHLSIKNTNTGDSVLSWRTPTGSWFCGIDNTNSDTSKPYGNNSWKLAYINGSGNLTSDFNSNTTKLGISTEGNLIGNGIIPIGGIVIWYGSVDEVIALEPSWALCDGRIVNGKKTPDLVARFVMGAGQVFPGDPNPTPVGKSGGSKDAILVSHSHTPGGNRTFGSSGGGFTVSNSNNITNNQSLRPLMDPLAKGDIAPYTSIEGESGVNANLPPYFALCYIMRTA